MPFAIFCLLLFSEMPASSKPTSVTLIALHVICRYMPEFPEVVGEDLLGNEIAVPSELKKEFDILLVAFQRWQQSLVNSWVPFLKDLVEKYSNTEFYELPTIREMNPVYRFFINHGMKAGIPSEETRGRTITLYLDKDSFTDSLGITDESKIYIYLVKRDGQILWHNNGPFTEEKRDSLESALENAIHNEL